MEPYLIRWHNFDGYKTRYLTAGEGEPLILLHGGGAGSCATANWRHTLPAYAEKYSVFAPEFVGFGLSDMPVEEHPYALSYRVRQIVDFMDSQCIENAYVLGNSYGGMISYYLAALHPKRVRKMVVQGAPISPRFLAGSLTPGRKVIQSYTPTYENQKAMCENLVYNKKLITDELIKERLEMTKLPGAMYALEKQRTTPRPDLKPLLPKLTVPTYIVHGREDSTCPVEDGIEASKLIPGAKIRVFDNVGHSVQIEAFEELKNIVFDFFP